MEWMPAINSPRLQLWRQICLKPIYTGEHEYEPMIYRWKTNREGGQEGKSCSLTELKPLCLALGDTEMDWCNAVLACLLCVSNKHKVFAFCYEKPFIFKYLIVITDNHITMVQLGC